MIRVIIVVLLLTVAGCATDYQSKGFTGGFSETQVAENIYRINFKANAYTNSEKAADFALLRAAELSRESGYSYFTIADSEDRVNSYVIGNEDSINTFHKPSSDLTVVMFNEKPEDQGIVYDARFVEQSIRSKYKIKSE